MNNNLLLILDQASFAPPEVKSDIMATLIAEGCINRKNKTATFFGELIVTILRLSAGKDKTKKIYKEYFLKNPQTVENDFALLISTLITKEPLSLIQDFLYALHLSDWQFKADDMKNYFDDVIKNTFGNNNEPPTTDQ